MNLMQQQDPSKGFEHFAKELVNVLKRVLSFCKHLLGTPHFIEHILYRKIIVSVLVAVFNACVVCRFHDAGAGRPDQVVQAGLV